MIDWLNSFWMSNAICSKLIAPLDAALFPFWVPT